jgi:hypothetical protein
MKFVSAHKGVVEKRAWKIMRMYSGIGFREVYAAKISCGPFWVRLHTALP